MEPFLQQLPPGGLSGIHGYSWPVAGGLLDATPPGLVPALHGGFPSLVQCEGQAILSLEAAGSGIPFSGYSELPLLLAARIGHLLMGSVSLGSIKS